MTEEPSARTEEAVAALRESEQRFREMADDAPVMLWVTDPDASCTYLNRRWYEFTGQTPETALGIGWLGATHPDDGGYAGKVFLAANERREPFRIEYRLRRHDGEYRWAIDVGAPRFAPDGAFLGYVGSVIDISDRKATEEALRESESRFRALFTSIDEGYCLGEMILDDAGRPVDYRFLEANPLFEAMTGLVDAVGRTAYELVPNLEFRWVETYARVALEGEPLRFEDGSDAMKRWFDVYATPVEPSGRFALVFKDITRRKLAEQALLEREAAERRARQQAELLTELADELEAIEDFDARVRRLVDLLVAREADFAWVELPASTGPVATIAHRDEQRVATVRAAWEHDRRLPAGAPSLWRATPPEHQLLGEITPGLVRELGVGDEAAALAGEIGVRSRIAVPLDLGAAVEGTLLLGSTDPERHPYDTGDLAFVRELSARIGVQFTRARLREEEHQVAVRLQRALLPAAVLRRPGVQLAARYEAGSDLLEVGGDWYDAFTLGDGQIAMTVGDVVGHGLEAAAAMGRLRTALAALAPHAGGPGRLLSLLDGFAVGANGAEFATACCAILDPATGVLRHASAGHPPMLAVSAEGEATWLEEGRSTPLYGEVDDERPEASVVLGPGALLVLYSDGLVERRREPMSVALARLEHLVVANREAHVEALCDLLVGQLGVDAARDDDVVVVCLRIAASGPGRFHQVFPARAERLRHLRADVRAWMAERAIVEPSRSKLLLALGEACSNAIEHAYVESVEEGGEGEQVEVEIAEEGSELRVEVRDFGAWRPFAEGREDRGRGTGIIEAVASGFTRHTGPGGTTVSFRLEREEQAAA